MQNNPIAIIGSGIAGLAAARTLAEAGRAVQLFDKSRGSGGRLASKRSNIGDLDIGAPYFTARDAHFQAAVAQWQAAGWVAPWTPALYRHQDGHLLRVDNDTQRWVGTPRMSALTRALLGDLPVRFNCRVTEVAASAGHWHLLDTDGNRHGPFGQVIVAVPAPQACVLLGAAPSLAARAASVSMHPTWTVVLGFRQPLPSAVEACFVRGAPLDWLARTSSKPDRDSGMDSWVLHADSAWSERHRELPATQVIARLHEAFAATIDCPLPPSDFSLAHRWLYARPAQPLSPGVLANPEAGLYACGDWCRSGRVEDAWLSGRDAALQLLERS